MDLPPDLPSSGGYRLPGGVDQTRVEVVRAADALGGLRTVLLLVWEFQMPYWINWPLVVVWLPQLLKTKKSSSSLWLKE